jgi:hypothetical protein
VQKATRVREYIRKEKEKKGLGAMAGVTKDMQIPFIITAATKTATSREREKKTFGLSFNFECALLAQTKKHNT